jgi:hypothetical protein
MGTRGNQREEWIELTEKIVEMVWGSSRSEIQFFWRMGTMTPGLLCLGLCPLAVAELETKDRGCTVVP